MKLLERFEKLTKAAQAYVRAVNYRGSIRVGIYPKSMATIDAVELLAVVKTATALGYETHLRVIDDTIHIYHVKNLPVVPLEVSYP